MFFKCSKNMFIIEILVIVVCLGVKCKNNLCMNLWIISLIFS